MKTKIIILSFLLLAGISQLKADPGGNIDVNFGFFYQNLSPMGQWIQIDAGVYGWHPYRVGADWRPYSVGRWAWTEDGWYWDSYEPFGWATYHYGRWIYDDYYGWIWIPDYEWAPAWVEWRYDNDYIGWAPLPPYAGFRIGFGIHFSIGWHSPFSYWNFVSYNHFCQNRVNDFFIDRSRVNFIFNRTRYRTNYFDRDNRIINGGIDRDFIERRGGYRIRESNIRNSSDMREAMRYSGGSDSYVRAFRPSEDEVRRTRDVEVRNAVRPDRNIAIDRERIAISPSRGNDVIVQREAERNNGNNERINARDRNTTRNGENMGTFNNRAAERNNSIFERNNRAVERNNSIFERNNRAVERNNNADRAIRNDSRQKEQPQRFEMNQNRGQQRIENQSERRQFNENRNIERRSAERGNTANRSNGRRK